MKKVRIQFMIVTLSIVGLSRLLSGSDVTVQFGEADTTEFPNICVPITVTDSSGSPVEDLTAEMVELYEDTVSNNSISIETIRESGQNVAVLLAVDASRSMTGEPLDSLKSALMAFTAQLRPGDQAGIIAFHDAVEVISVFTDDKDTLSARMGNIAAKGSRTELYYGISKGLDLINETENLPDRKYLIVFSDGKDEGEAYTFEDCVNKAVEFDVPIYSVGFHTRVGAQYLRILERMSDKSKGEYNDAETTGDLGAIYNLIFEHIQDRAVLCFTADYFKADGEEHSVGVKIIHSGQTVESNFTFVSPEGTSLPVSEEESLGNLWVIVVIGLSAIFLVAVVVIRSRKRKREEEEQLAQEKQRLEDEKKEKEKQAEKVAEEKKAAEKKGDKKDKAVKNTHVSAPSPRHTVISGKMPDLQGIVLQFDSGNLQGQTVSVASETTIGRGKDNDIVIDDPTVSGHHCKIVVEDSRFTIVDLDSTNGTNVNGSKVSKMMITSGTALKLGAVRISVK